MSSVQTLFSHFREQTLSAVQAGSSVQAYNSRLSHLEPLAAACFRKESVDEWLEKVHKTRSHNSARELVRLAKKFWIFGVENGAWHGTSPFRLKDKSKVRDDPSLPSRFLSPPQIRAVLDNAPDAETRAFWACCVLAGLRQSEAAGLTLRQLSLGVGSAKIIGLSKRGGAPDYVEISDELAKLLSNVKFTPPPPLRVI